MEIGGVHFAISSEIPNLFQNPEPAYRPFLITENNYTGPVDIQIHIRSGCMPGIEKMKKIFDSGQSWSMFQNGDNFWLVLGSTSFKEPFLLAKINHDFTLSVVYLNEDFLNQRNGKRSLSNPAGYPLDQILLMYILARRHGALLHASAIDINGRGYIFPGKSGAGKSTITRQFVLQKDIDILSDDRIVVKNIDGAFKVYGTPWPGESGFALNKSVTLAGIFFINRSSANRIKEITGQEAMERLLPVTSIPWYDREVMPKIITFCEDLVSHVPVYELCFRPDIEVVNVFEKFVSA